MQDVRDIITLAVLFCSLYFEVFMLITYLERRHTLHKRVRTPALSHTDLPTVTIIVPCFNEETTVGRTIESLLGLDYPSDKLTIMAINDGSTDGTAKALQAFADRVQVIHKENGGKHTALNLGITQATSEFVGCLDADSYVAPDALIRLVRRFDTPEIMAVVPSLHIYKAKTLIQKMQKIEYLLGVFLRSMQGELNALYVTPGPFSIMRRAVFAQIGPYKKAHNTEDMEIAFRMQSHGMTLAAAHDAVVYTSSPRAIRTLYKQRVRWTSGFLFNLRDYRHMIFSRNNSHLGWLILPLMIISTASVIFVAGSFIYDGLQTLHRWYVHFGTLGLRGIEFHWPSFDWFFFHTSPMMFAGIVAFITVMGFIIIGTRLSAGNRPKLFEVACYVVIYPLVVPFWIAKSVFNVVTSTQAVWR